MNESTANGGRQAMSGVRIMIVNGLRRLVDTSSGHLVQFKATQVPGKGWTVAKVVGSLRVGRSIERAEGFEGADSYTMHQAQAAASVLERDTLADLSMA